MLCSKEAESTCGIYSQQLLERIFNAEYKAQCFASVNTEESDNCTCNNDGFDICHFKTFREKLREMNSECFRSYEVV